MPLPLPLFLLLPLPSGRSCRCPLVLARSCDCARERLKLPHLPFLFSRDYRRKDLDGAFCLKEQPDKLCEYVIAGSFNLLRAAA